MTWCGRVICYQSCLPSTLTILGMGTVFAALLFLHITPHLATHCLWNAVVTATTFDSYYLLSRAVWLRVSNTSPDGGSAPSWLSPTGRSRCHLVRETDDRNGFISALRRLCNVITLMWFILAFRHADHRPAPASTRHFYCSPDTAINTRQANQTIMNLTFDFINILQFSIR